MEQALILVVIVVAAVTGYAHRRAGKSSGVGMRELSDLLGAFVIVALVALIAILAADGTINMVAGAILNALLSLLPWLLIRLAGAFEPFRRRTHLAVMWVSIGVAALGLAAPEDSGSVVTRVWLAAGLVLWVSAAGLAAVRLWRGGRQLSSTVGRMRSGLMAAGLALLGVTIVLAAFEGVGDDGGFVAALVGLAGAVVFTLGFTPPPFLRSAWTRRDLQELQSAEIALLRHDNPDVIASELLPHIARLLGAEAAILKVNGEMEAEYGDDTAGLNQLENPGSEGVTVTPVPDSPAPRFHLVAATRHAVLAARVGPYSLHFAGAELEAFTILMARLDLALDRGRLRAKELEYTRLAADARRVGEIQTLREDMLATVSHELGTPLTMIRGGSELLRTRWEDLEEAQRYQLTERIAANAMQLSDLVGQVLSLASLRIGGVGSNPKDLDLAGLVHVTVDRLRPTLQGRSVAVEAPESLHVETDPVLVERILEQLVANAGKFSADGAPIRVVLEESDTSARLSVEDRGAGMTHAELDEIFEPFFRGGNVLRRETRGLGVGLAIVEHLTSVIGGRIEVSSRPGEGSTFTLCLPTRFEQADERPDGEP